MLSKCANPNCNARLHYLRSGKLFRFDVPVADANAKNGGVKQGVKKPAHRLEHFWLCGKCAASMTMKNEKNRGVIVIPIEKPQYHRASA